MSRWLPARRNAGVERRSADVVRRNADVESRGVRSPAPRPDPIPLDLDPCIEFTIVGGPSSGSLYTLWLTGMNVVAAENIERVIRMSPGARDVRRIN